MLRPIGRVYPVRPDGTLPRLGSPPLQPWCGHCEDVSGQVRRLLGQNLVSVALRGSAARGMAVVGGSDLDFVVVTEVETEISQPMMVAAAPGLAIETYCTTEDSLLNDRSRAWMRFNLAFSGWTVFGREVIAGLPDPVLNKVAVAHLKGLDRWFDDWPGHFDQAGSAEEKRSVCAWLMKRAVRSVFESVMLTEQSYSRDIYPCAIIACRHYPEHTHIIIRAAMLAVAPTQDKTLIEDVAGPMHDLLLIARDRFQRMATVGD